MKKVAAGRTISSCRKKDHSRYLFTASRFDKMAEHPQLAKILASLAHLNLEGDITDKQERPVRFGGMCDVFTARSIEHNKKVAVKRIRAHLEGNEAFAKVGVLETTIRRHRVESLIHLAISNLLRKFESGKGSNTRTSSPSLDSSLRDLHWSQACCPSGWKTALYPTT